MSNAEQVALAEAVKRISPGQKIVYHVGFLAIDRGKWHWVNAIATEAWGAHMKGVADLTQERVRSEVYRYIATGRHFREGSN